MSSYLKIIPQDIESIIYKYLHNLYMIEIRENIKYVKEQCRSIQIFEGKLIYSSFEHSSFRMVRVIPRKHHFDRYSNNLFLFKYFIKTLKKVYYQLFLYHLDNKDKLIHV